MAPRIQLAPLADFTGGLNLRADQFQLASNESPDMLNVDVDPRGGFRQRKGVATFGPTLGGVVSALIPFETSGGVHRVITARADGQVWWTDGASTGSLASGRGAKHRGATFKDKVYLQDGAHAAMRYDGTTLNSALGTAWNDDLTNPSGGNMPKAACVAVHQGSAWVANTIESSGTFKNRIRWSHPNFPEDWRSFDFIDVDTGVDGDEITALVPFGDRLLVFKRRSIHAIYGFGPDGFQVLPVSQTAGSVSQEAVVATDIGVYFFSWPQGVFVYDGKNLKWLFERIYPAIRDGAVPDAYQSGITLGWGNRRLWASVPWGASTVNARTFVLDPTLGKDGAWAQYDMGLGPIVDWRPTGLDTVFIAAHASSARVLKLDVDSTVADNFGAGAVHIDSYYRTRWVDFGQSAVVKRWKRPEMVLLGGGNTDVFVQVFTDYDASNPQKSFHVTTIGSSGNTLTWDGDTAHGWNQGLWARTSADRNDMVKGQPLGSARSVSLRFNGPLTNVTWGVDSTTFKFIPRQVRS